MGKNIKKTLIVICVIAMIATLVNISYRYYHNKKVEALVEVCYGDNVEVDSTVIEEIRKCMTDVEEPDTYGEYYLQAILDLKDGDYEKAAESFVKSADYIDEEDNAKKAEAYKKAGACYVSASDYENALPYFDKALEYCPQDEFALLYEAECCLQLEDYANTLKYMEEYRKVAEVTEDQYDTVFAMYIGLGRYDEAAECILEAMEKYPDNKATYLLYELQAYLLKGDDEKSLEVAKEYCNLSEEELIPEILIAAYYSELEMYEEARDAYVAYMDANKDANYYVEAIEACYQIDDYDTMLKLAEKGYSISSTKEEKVEYNKWKAIVYLQRGNYSYAASLFNTYLEVNPEHYEVIYLRGLCYFSLSNYNKAIEDFTSTINGETLVEDSLYNRSLCYVQINNLDKAVEDLNTIVELNSGSETYDSAKELLKVLD